MSNYQKNKDTVLKFRNGNHVAGQLRDSENAWNNGCEICNGTGELTNLLDVRAYWTHIMATRPAGPERFCKMLTIYRKWQRWGKVDCPAC